MAVLKGLLAAAITGVAIINGVAGVSTVRPSRSLTEAVAVTAELFSTTLTTTLTFTNGGGVQLPPLPSVLPTYAPGYPVRGDVNGAVKGKAVVTNIVTVPATNSTITFSSAIAATKEAHADIPDMTLSLSMSTSAETYMLPTAIFPDPGIFGHLPPVETASTKYTALTTPDFPVVPSIMPNRTRPGRHFVDETAPLGASTPVAISDIISVIPTDGLVYGTDLPTLLTHKTSSSYSNGQPSKVCDPSLDGMQHHGHSWTCLTLPSRNTLSSHLDSQQEYPHTKRHGSYSYSITAFTDQILSPWESTRKAHHVYTENVTRVAGRFPTNLPGPPQPNDKAEESLPLKTTLSEGTVSRDHRTRTPMAHTGTSNHAPTYIIQPVLSSKITPIHSSQASETLQWTTITVTRTTCESFFTTGTTGYTSRTGKTSQKTLPTAFTCTTKACADQPSLPPGETPDLPFHPQPSGDLTSTLPWIASSRLPWHARNTITISNGTIANPADENMDVVASSQIRAPFSTLHPGLFTPEIENPTQPTGTPTLPHEVWPVPILSGISAFSHSTFTAEMTTLETSIRSTKA